MKEVRKSGILRTIPLLIVVLFALNLVKVQAQDSRPIADAGLSRYAGPDPVVLDGTGSYDPDGSAMFSYEWQQIAGPPVVINDENTATPMISGFTQTDEIQECKFELVVSDGELTSLPDTVKVIIVPDFGAGILMLENPPFEPDKPTVMFFDGGGCVTGGGEWWGARWEDWDTREEITAWHEKANIISFYYYEPDRVAGLRTYYQNGDMIIVYLSSVAPDYKQPIQTIGWSTGAQPAVDVGIRLNATYQDSRYAVNRVTLQDASIGCRSYKDYSESIAAFVGSSVDGEQCWIDNYVSERADFYPNALSIGFEVVDHSLAPSWYKDSLEGSDMNKFNNGVVAGAYWSVIGLGKNLQLKPTQDTQTYKFKWYGDNSSGYMDFWDEPNHPSRLPEPVTLVGPSDSTIVDANGALLSCKESENAVGYQLLFGPDPYHLVYLFSDTSSPPSEIVTTFPFEETWWTVKVRDQYGSTIYADPICVYAEDVKPKTIENVTMGKGYGSIQDAIDDAQPGGEIIVSEGIWQQNINFKGKNLMIRSVNPNDPVVVAATVIKGNNQDSVVTFSSGEDANCILAGFTVTGGTRGIYCSGASPTITNCTIVGNVNADMGAGMLVKDGSSPKLVNCMFISNSASVMGGGMYTENSNQILINCTFAGNSAVYFGGGIYCAIGSPVLTNCILWGDTPEEISTFVGTPVITYSDVQGGWAGEGNIDADPLFADPVNGDYHLKSQAGRWNPASQSWIADNVTSPCINSGNPSTPVGSEPLPNGGIINMGAYGGAPEASKSP
ncbi:MAG: PKD domain-containing protein [Planctomycetota bacterium]|jgi:predicted outer membrane repeat protein